MRISALFFALFVSTCMVPAYSGCALSDGKGVEWPDVLQCGPDVDNIVDVISTILLGAEKPGAEAEQTTIGKNAKAELEKLAREHGADTVACLVDLLQRDWSRPGASSTPQRFAAVLRARDFLSVEGVRVESNEAFKP